MAAVDFISGCTHALGERSAPGSGWTVRSFLATMYQLGFDFQAVSSDFRVEQVGIRHALGRPNELLFLLGQNRLRNSRCLPDATRYVRPRLRCRRRRPFSEVRLLCLRCLVGVGSERGNVDQPRKRGRRFRAPVMTLPP